MDTNNVSVKLNDFYDDYRFKALRDFGKLNRPSAYQKAFDKLAHFPSVLDTNLTHDEVKNLRTHGDRSLTAGELTDSFIITSDFYLMKPSYWLPSRDVEIIGLPCPSYHMDPSPFIRKRQYANAKGLKHDLMTQLINNHNHWMEIEEQFTERVIESADDAPEDEQISSLFGDSED